MEKSLFHSSGDFYKANLHGHTKVSDGRESVEEVKGIYKSMGYQILAYTDHDVMVDHSDLNDENFLALTSFEYEYTEPNPENISFDFLKTYHFCLYAPRADETYYPQANPDYARIGNAANYVQEYYKGNAPHEFDIEQVNALIEDAHAHGFLIAYNHPYWSINTAKDYEKMGPVDFMECGNTGCFLSGYVNDYTDTVYHEMLMNGHRCFPTATDDGHSLKDYGKAWTMIKADRLDFESVFASMKRGDLYATWGPEIHNILFDPESCTLKVQGSPIRYISMMTERRAAHLAGNGKDLITEACIDLTRYVEETKRYAKEPEKAFVRFVLIDAEGRKAVSRAYGFQELMEE